MDGRERAVNGNTREALSHIRPPPGKTPDFRRCENRRADSRMALVGNACKTFTGVILPLKTGCHTSRGITMRTVLLGPLPLPLLLN